MINAAFFTKCFDSIYYLQQGATRWRLKTHTEGSMMPCRFRRRRWKMWTKRRCKGTWMVWKRQAFLKTFFNSPLDLNFFNIRNRSLVCRNLVLSPSLGGDPSQTPSTTSSGIFYINYFILVLKFFGLLNLCKLDLPDERAKKLLNLTVECKFQHVRQ